MSSFAQNWIDTALYPLKHTQSLITNTYTYITTQSTEAKSFVHSSIKYIQTASTGNKISTNTALLLGLTPRLIDISKSNESEQLIRRLISIITDAVYIIQLPQVRTILLELYEILKSTQFQQLVSDSSNLLLDSLKLLQCNETNELLKQIESIAQSLFGDYLNRKSGDSTTTTVQSIDIWIEMLHYIELLQQCNLLTEKECRILRTQCRKQNTELLILYQGYGDKSITVTDDVVSENTRQFVQFARELIDELA